MRSRSSVLARYRGRRVVLGLGITLCLVAVPILAYANAANPCGSSATAGVCPPSNASPTGTEVVNSDGTATVTVNGLFSWLSQQANGNDGCGGHYGVGWGIIWNDASDPGFVVKHDPITEQVGSVGSSLNAKDEAVHYNANQPCGNATTVNDPNHPGQTVTIPVGNWGPGTSACIQSGQQNPTGLPTCPALTNGQLSTGATPLTIVQTTHTYTSASAVPSLICVNMYDLHQPFSVDGSGTPNNNYVVDKNGDNSIQTNSFNPSAGSGSCFAPTPPPPPKGSFVGNIYDCNNDVQTTTEQPGGSIAISGPSGNLSGNDSGSGVTISNLTPGGYGVTATAPTGWEFITCGSPNYTVSNGGGTATYNSPVNVPSGGTGHAQFYVIKIPATPVTLWIQTIDSCRFAVGGASYAVFDSSGNLITTGSGAAGPSVTVSHTSGCPIQGGNCVSVPTGCVSFSLTAPASGTATFTVKETAAAAGYFPCNGGSACQQAVMTVTIDSSGHVRATLANTDPDGFVQQLPSHDPNNGGQAFWSGTQTDPGLFFNEKRGTTSCDGDNDADDHNGAGPGGHCDNDQDS